MIDHGAREQIRALEQKLAKFMGEQTKQEKMDDIVSNLKYPETFHKCGHPFPNFGVAYDENCLYEQKHTCSICGEIEYFP